MDLLGPSLKDLFEFCEKKFNINTIMWLATQMIQRIQQMHEHEYLHRDIKPENFLIGSSKKVNTIYAIDFGLAKRFIDPKTGSQYERKKMTNFTGTQRYASMNAHKKYQPCRADDLEAIGNVLIYFFNEGNLPWMWVEKELDEITEEKQR